MFYTVHPHQCHHSLSIIIDYKLCIIHNYAYILHNLDIYIYIHHIEILPSTSCVTNIHYINIEIPGMVYSMWTIFGTTLN